MSSTPGQRLLVREAELANYRVESEQEKLLKKVVAITGTIGSGKSSFCRLLEEAGKKVVYADVLAREAMENLSSSVISEFGPTIAAAGKVDRKKLGELVFADPTRLKKLESILHPEVRRLALLRFAELLNGASDYIFYEVPLFFETGMQLQGFSTSVLLTVNSDDLAIKRILARGDLNEAEARSRIASQMSADAKIQLADIVIENNLGVDELRIEAKNLLAFLDRKF